MKKREEEFGFEWRSKRDERELMDLVFILIRNWKLIIMTALPVMVLGALFAITKPDIYQSEVVLMVSDGQVYSSNNLDYDEISKNQKLTSTYTEIAESQSIMRSVIRKLDLDVKPQKIAKSLKVTSIDHTELIKISYRDKDNQRAALLANEISKELVLKIKEIMSFENLEIVESATVAEEPLPKKRSIILLVSMALGAMLGINVAFIAEFLHSKLRRPKDFEKIMSGAILSNIPTFNFEKTTSDQNVKGLREKFFREYQDTHLAESLRVLRTNIHFMEEKENRIIVFTSTVPREGKSTIATNYAKSVSISGEKVLLVDCDIRRPRAHSSFGIEITHGMGSVLLGEKKVEEVILVGIEKNLDILPSKHLSKNVTELFLGNNMKKLLRELRGKYDLIVLDTPPLTVATDAVILSEYSDGVIYTCGYDMVSEKELIQSKEILDRAKANIYGIVVNKVNKAAYSYGNYGYYNYNYKYYKEYIKGDK